MTAIDRLNTHFNWNRTIAMMLCAMFIVSFMITPALFAAPTKQVNVEIGSAMLTDQHHYYRFSGQLIDQNSNDTKEIYVVWSIAGEANWTETPAQLAKKSAKSAKWNFDVNIPSKSDVDQYGVVYMIMVKQDNQTTWLNNQGAYFLIGGKSSNVYLGSQQVIIENAKIDSWNQLKGTVIVKNLGFGATVTLQLKTDQSKSVKIIKAKRNGAVPHSNNTLQSYVFETNVNENVKNVQLVAIYKVNGKTYKDPESGANYITK